MEICYVFFGVVCFFLLLYMVFEFHYFVRTFMYVLWAKVCRKKQHILDETRVSSICCLTDIDYLLNHMNNARFIRELDFAKFDFYERTGLYKKIRSAGGSVFSVATTIRYRKFIKVFHKYHVTTKIIYWDSQNIYMEHRFITPSNNFINAIVMCKSRVTNCNVEDLFTDMMGERLNNEAENTKATKPEKSLELERWIESNEISSAALRS